MVAYIGLFELVQRIRESEEKPRVFTDSKPREDIENQHFAVDETAGIEQREQQR